MALEQLEPRQLLIGSEWSNSLSPLNVNNDSAGLITPVDALLIINEINTKQIQNPATGALPPLSTSSPQPPPFIDVNCDRFVSPLDALLVINDLNGNKTTVGNAYETSDGVRGNYFPLGCGAVLRESNSFVSTITTHLTIPANAAAISIVLVGVELDTASTGRIHDAFEAALLDSNGRTLVHSIGQDRDAFYNSTEAAATLATSQVIVSGNRVTLSLADVLPGTQADLVFRLVNNDGDPRSIASIRSVEFQSTFPGGVGLGNVDQAPSQTAGPSVLPDNAFLGRWQFPEEVRLPTLGVVPGRAPTSGPASTSSSNSTGAGSEGPPSNVIDSRGTEFWIGFPDNLFEGNNRPQKALYITGDVATTGFVEIPGLIDPVTSLAFRKEFIVNPGESTAIELPSLDVGDNGDIDTDFDVEVELIARVQQKGVHVVTNEPVSVYGLDLATSTSDAFLALPVSALGTEYINLGYENTYASISHVEGTQFLVVATEDDTQVTLTPGGYSGATEESSAQIMRPNGTVPFGLQNSSGRDFGPFVSDAAGAYSLSVEPPFEGYSGRYTFEVVDIATAAVPASMGETIHLNFPTGRESRVVSFDVVAGQRLIYDAINPSPAPNVVVRLISPSGEQATLSAQNDNNAFVNFFGATQFTETGKYYVMVVGEQSAAFDFTFRMIDADTAPKLDFGVDAIGINNPAGRAAVYRIDGVAGQVLLYDAIDDSRLVTFSLYGPGGSQVTTLTAADDGIAVLPETGTYLVYMDSVSFLPSTFGFRLIDLQDLPTLSMGTTTQAHVAEGRRVAYRFDGTAAQTLNVNLQSVSQPFRTLYSLLDPAGNEVALSTTLSSLSAKLLTSGQYTLSFRVFTTGEVTDVTFTASLVADPPVAKSGFNSLQTLTIAPGASAIYQFDAPAGTRVVIDGVDNTNENLYIELNAPDGKRLFGQFDLFGELQDIPRFDPAFLPQSGTYTLTLRGNTAAAAGSYSFRVLDMDTFGTPLSLDTVVSNTFPTGREAYVYAFDATAGDRLNFDGQSGSFIFGVYDPLLTAIYSRGIFGAASTAEVDGVMRITRTGRHYVLFHGDPSIAQSFSFQLQDLSTAPSLSLGVEASGTVAGNSQVSYRMSLIAGQRIRVDTLLPDPGGINLKIANMGGRVLFNTNFQSVDSGPPSVPYLVVAETGEYFLSVQSRTTVPTNFRLRVDDLGTVPQLNFGTDLDIILDPGYSAQSFKIVATAGDTIQLDNLGSSLPLIWQLTGPVNQFLGGDNNGSDFSAKILSTGTHYLTISGRQSSGPITMQFRATRTAGPIVPLSGVNAKVDLDVGLHESKTHSFSIPTGSLIYVNVLKSDFAIPTHTVTLDKGDTYLLRDSAAGIFASGADLTGSIITSSKSVAVFGSNRATFIPNDFFAADHLVEQLPPTNSWGREFVTMPLETGSSRGDRFRFLAQADNSQVTVNGTVVVTLNRGEFFETTLTGPAHIVSNEPVLVAQYAHSQNYYRTNPGGNPNFLGDPLMMIIPPSEQFLANYTVSTPVESSILTTQRFDRNFINIVVPADALGQIELDGSAIAESLFDPIGDSGYFGAQVPIELGSHLLNGALPFGAFVYGFGSFDSYGYVGGQSLSRVAEVSSVILTPASANPIINTSLQFTARVADASGTPLEGIRVDFDVAGVNPQKSFAFSDSSGQVQFSYFGATQGRDVVTASVGQLLDDSIVDWQASASPPTIIVSAPIDGSRVLAGTTLVASGIAFADFPNATLDLITVNGLPVEAVDAAGNFFVSLFVGPGENEFEFSVTDSSGQVVSQTITVSGAQPNNSEFDLSSFADVSGSFELAYARTSYNQFTETLFAETAVKNAGQFPADVPLVVAITNISDPMIQVRSPDGRTADGDPYYDFTGLVTGGTLSPRGQSGFLSAAFFNPNHAQFTYDLVFLAKLNEPPQITSLPITNAVAGIEYTYQVSAVDPNGDVVAFSLSESPASMTIDRNSGLVRWTPASGDVGVYSVEIQAADPRQGISTQRFSLTARSAATNRAPVITSLPTSLAAVGVAYSYSTGAIDVDGDALSFRFITSPGGMTIDANSGLVQWQPTSTQLGSQNIVIEVADGNGAIARQAFTLFVTSPTDNSAPIILSTFPSAANFGQFNHQVLARDAESDSINYFLLVAPAGMAIDPTGHIFWNSTLSDVGDHQVVVQVVDGRGGVDRQQFTLAVYNNQNPTITSQPVTTAQVGSNYSYPVAAQDPNGDSLTFKLLDSPVGMSISPTGLIQWNIPLNAFEQEQVIAEVADGRGGSAIQQFSINVSGGRNRSSSVALQFNSNPPSVATVGTALRYTALVRNTGGGAHTFKLLLAPDGMVIDPLTGQLGWLPRSDQTGAHQVVIRVDDGIVGGIGLQAFQIEVDASNTAPVITSEPIASASVGRLWEYRLHTQDADNDQLSFELVSPVPGLTLTTLQNGDADAVLSLMANSPGNVPVVLTVKDGRGGVTEQHFAIAVTAAAANVAPVVTSTPRTHFAAGQPWFYFVEVNDPDADPLTIALTAGPNDMVLDTVGRTVSWTPGTDDLGSHAVTLRFSDGRGGITEQSFAIEVLSVNDNQAPEIVSPPAAFRATVGQLLEYNLRASDSENDPVEWRLIDAPHGTSLDARLGTLRWTAALDQIGLQRFVISARDPAGLESLQSFSILVSGANLGPSILSRGPSEAVVDERYVYGVRVVDPENDSLTYNLTSAPVGMVIDAQRGIIRWTPTANQVGTANVTLEVRDANGNTSTQTYAVQVSLVVRNKEPVITSRAVFKARIGAEYLYDVEAFDPEVNLITYSLAQAPAGMQIDTLTGIISWTPTAAQIGAHLVRVAASDTAGNVSLQRFAVQARENQAPVISSIAPTTVSLGATYRYDLQVTDVEQDLLTYELMVAPTGMSIDSLGRIRWTTAPGVDANNPIFINVRDSFGATVTQSYTLVVTPDQTAPNVQLQLTSNPLALGQDAVAFIQASDDVGIVEILLTLDGVPQVLDGNNSILLHGTTSGLYTLRATAHDASGNIGTSEVVLRVFDPADTQGPNITIAAPIPYAVVTSLTDIVGSISDDNLQFYRVDVGRADLVDVNEPTLEDADYKTISTSNAAATDAVLATFDPTALLNDDYVIRILARDLSGNSTAQVIPISLNGQLKLGEFTLEFTDLSVPVAGVPISIVRTYDTRSADVLGDFGYGWTLSTSDPMIRESIPVNPFEEEGLYFAATPFREGTRVYLTNPDGQRVGFTFKPKLQVSLFGGGTFAPEFVPDKGVHDKLDVGSVPLRKINGAFYSGFFGDPFNPSAYRLTTKDGTVYEYGQFSGLDNIKDRSGNRLDFRSDGVFSSTGTSIEFVRDPQNRITKIIDPAGNALTYSYDAQGNLKTFSNQEDNVTRFDYLAVPAHYLDKVVDPRGNSGILTEFDDQGRLSAIVDAQGNRTVAEYDTETQTESITDPRGNTTTRVYDEKGNLLAQIDPLGNRTESTFDENNNEISRTDPRGNTTTRAYDVQGNVVQVVDPLGNTTTSIYNGFSLPLLETDALGRLTVYRYGAEGVLTERVDADGGVTKSTHDSSGRPEIVADPEGRITRFEFGQGGQLPTRIVHGDGSSINVEYNELRKPIRIVDERGRVVQIDYDRAGRRTRIVQPDGSTTDSIYDEAGNVISVVDALGNETTYLYDSKNNLISETDSLNQTTRYSYDAAGNRIEQIDRSGKRRTFVFDAGGQLVDEIWWNGAIEVNHIRSSYDRAGNLVSQSDNVSAYTYLYDTLNRVTSVDNANSPASPHLVLNYKYDAVGNRTSIADNLGATVNTTYTLNDLMARVQWQPDAVNSAAVEFGYDMTGAVTSIERFSDANASPIRSDFTYDDRGHVVSIAYRNATGNVLVDFNYNYDLACHQISDQHHGASTEYVYDANDQVTTVKRDSQVTEFYKYDANGNRIESKSSAAYVIGADNRVLSDGTFTYEYDAEGNLITKREVSSGIVTSFDFDHRGRLVKVSSHAAGGLLLSEVSFTYDVNDRRIAQTTNGVTTYFTYNDNQIWADFNSSQNPESRYLLGSKTDQLLAKYQPGEGTSWYVTDRLGTVHDLLNSTGAIVGHRSYESFGQVLSVSGSLSSDRFAFVGREVDQSLGLYFYRARYYDPALGRFISQDPIGFEGRDANLYRYVSNDPVNATDSTGKAIDVERLTAIICSQAIFFAILGNLIAQGATYKTQLGAPPILGYTMSNIALISGFAIAFSSETIIGGLCFNDDVQA